MSIGNGSRFKMASVAALAIAATSYIGLNAARGEASAEDRQACTPDVFRLCSSEIPNVDRIVACLQKEKPRLSAGCRAVFNREAANTKSATRSIVPGGSSWCDFSKSRLAPGQKDWQSWCSSKQ